MPKGVPDGRDTTGATLAFTLEAQQRKKRFAGVRAEAEGIVTRDGMMVADSEPRQVRCTKLVAPSAPEAQQTADSLPRGKHRVLTAGTSPATSPKACLQDPAAAPIQTKKHFLGTHHNTESITNHGHAAQWRRGAEEEEGADGCGWGGEGAAAGKENRCDSFHRRVMQEGFPVKPCRDSAPRVSRRALMEQQQQQQQQQQEERGGAERGLAKSFRFACRPKGGALNPLSGNDVLI